MSIIYKAIPSERLVADKIICDRCGKELEKHMGESFNDHGTFFSAWFDDYFHLKQDWGFYSNKDQDHDEAIICEACYDEIFKGVKIQKNGPCHPDVED